MIGKYNNQSYSLKSWFLRLKFRRDIVTALVYQGGSAQFTQKSSCSFKNLKKKIETSSDTPTKAPHISKYC